MEQTRILLPSDERIAIARRIGVSPETVRLALLFKRNGEISRRIRTAAMELGGKVYTGEPLDPDRTITIVERVDGCPPLVSKVAFLEPTILALADGLVLEEITEQYVAFSTPTIIAYEVERKVEQLIETLR